MSTESGQLQYTPTSEKNIRSAKPTTIGKFYTVSMNVKAALRLHLEAMLGTLKMPFEVASIVGTGCLVTVGHAETDAGQRARIASVAALPKGMEPPTAYNELITYSFDTPDPTVLGKLPDWLVEKVKAAPEWGQMSRAAGRTRPLLPPRHDAWRIRKPSPPRGAHPGLRSASPVRVRVPRRDFLLLSARRWSRRQPPECARNGGFPPNPPKSASLNRPGAPIPTSPIPWGTPGSGPPRVCAVEVLGPAQTVAKPSFQREPGDSGSLSF